MENAIENFSCFKAHEMKNKMCKNQNCRHWHDLDNFNNCILNKVNENEPYTLQDIGDIFNITRMRICQIEKQAISKLKNKIK